MVMVTSHYNERCMDDWRWWRWLKRLQRQLARDVSMRSKAVASVSSVSSIADPGLSGKEMRVPEPLPFLAPRLFVVTE
jgi:hypothetical protein